MKPLIRTPVLLLVWLSLMALTLATFWVSKLSLGATGETISLLIAAAKAGLVASVFMELRASGYRVRMFGLAGLIWLSLLFVFTLADFLTRLS